MQTNTNKANKTWSSYKQTQTRQSRHDPPTNKHKQEIRHDPPTNKHKQGNQDMILLQTNTNKAIKTWSSYKQTQTRQTRHDPPTNKHKQGKQDMILLQTNTNKAIKTWALLQTTGGKDEPNIVLCGNHN